MACMIVGTPALPFSTCVMRRARARRSPPTMRSTSAAGSRREVASGPAIGERPDFSMSVSGGRPAALRDFYFSLASNGGALIPGSPRLRLRLAPRPRDVLRLARRLLPHEHEIGQHLNVVRDLEEEQLWDLHAVRG